MNIIALKVILVIACLMSEYPGMPQSAGKNYPVIGEPIPPIKLTNVHYYSQNTFDPREIKGKWIILDFWSKYCTSCVQAFPKINQLQNEFKDNIQFLLIGKNDKKYSSDIEKIFDRYQKVLGLNLPVAYDTMLFKQFGVEGVPHVVIIDPGMNVYAITSSDFFSKENIKALIENEKPKFRRVYGVFDENPNKRWKYLVDENELKSNDLFYRSVLSANKGESTEWYDIESTAKDGFCQVVGVDLFKLYNLAYLGVIDLKSAQPSLPLRKDYYSYPVLEMKNSSAFHSNSMNNIGFFNYSLIVLKKKATKTLLMDLMQRDLKNYFGYEVSIEKRKMPYWRLTSTEEAKQQLKTKSAKTDYTAGLTGIEGKKISTDFVLLWIEDHNGDELIPFVNETNIKGSIDINFSAVMTNMEDVRKELRKNGLILEKTMKEMKVLVIRDPKHAD